MKFVFLIQGEGRGHMTQALNLKELLEKKGYLVSKVLVGSKNLESLPSFFVEKINCPIEILTSPKFKIDKKGQGILLFKSIVCSLFEIPAYLRSLKKIKKIIKEENPTAIISFYEPLTAFYFRFFRENRPGFFIGHQYFMSHPAFNNFFRKKKEKLFFRIYNSISSIKKGVKICLSFTEETDLLEKNIYICPPLIKSEIKKISLNQEKNYLLIYILNKGYSEKIINWSQKNPYIKIEAFRNSPDKKIEQISPSLTFHHLNNDLFNLKLRDCRAYVSTAGFDSIAEAAYLGKKILMVPTKNHFEQNHNAIDAKRAKIAISSTDFDLSLILKAENKDFSGSLKYR